MRFAIMLVGVASVQGAVLDDVASLTTIQNDWRTPQSAPPARSWWTGLPHDAIDAPVKTRKIEAIDRPMTAQKAQKASWAVEADIAWMRDAFRDLLRIRASTPLFRLRSADEVQRRLAFRNAGPAQNPLVIAGHLDGSGMAGAFAEVLYLLNVSPEPQTLVLPDDAGKAYVLHPLQAAGSAADARAKQARYRAADGHFSVPGRTAVVFVIERKE